MEIQSQTCDPSSDYCDGHRSLREVPQDIGLNGKDVGNGLFEIQSIQRRDMFLCVSVSSTFNFLETVMDHFCLHRDKQKTLGAAEYIKICHGV